MRHTLATSPLTTTRLPKRTDTTPPAWAKSFAKTNQNFAGVLTVISTTPAGRWGRETKDKKTHFYLMGGICAQTREQHEPANPAEPFGAKRFYRNGYCQCCGRLYQKPALTLAWDLDWQIVACLACIGKHGLNLRADRADYRAVRLLASFSPLAVYGDDKAPQASLDIRGQTPLAVVPFNDKHQPSTVSAAAD